MIAVAWQRIMFVLVHRQTYKAGCKRVLLLAYGHKNITVLLNIRELGLSLIHI